MVDIEGKLEWFGKELRERMEDEEIRPGVMACKCRVKPGSFYNYTQGKTFPQLWNLCLIADYLGATVNDLLDYDEPDEDNLVGYECLSMFEDEDEFAMHVHNRVNNAMIDADIDIFELAERTRFARSAIRKWFGFNDKDPDLPRTSDFLQICEAIGTTPSDLLGY